jgi:hypothetical protein
VITKCQCVCCIPFQWDPVDIWGIVVWGIKLITMQTCSLAYSDSDSDWSSLERRQRAADIYSKVNRKPTPHKRIRKKRTAIPVATPRVPPLQPPFAAATADGAGVLNYRFKEERARGGCDSSEKGIDDNHSSQFISLHSYLFL